MTQNTQTTADRMFELMREIRIWDVEHDATDHRAVANIVAAEIDRLTAERDKAQAEVERLRLPAEAWETQEHYDSLRVAPMADVLAADAAMKVAAARARKAANLKKLVAEQEQAAARARAAKVTP